MERPVEVNDPNLQGLKDIVDQYIEEVCNKGYEGVDEDLTQYVFEAAVMAFYGPNIFRTLSDIRR